MMETMFARTTYPFIMESFDTELTNPSWRDICHTPHTIQLFLFGHIHKPITIRIMVCLFSACRSKLVERR